VHQFVCVAAAIFAAATQTFGVPHTAAIRDKSNSLLERSIRLEEVLPVEKFARQ
jgi:hypothetical protein